MVKDFSWTSFTILSKCWCLMSIHQDHFDICTIFACRLDLGNILGHLWLLQTYFKTEILGSHLMLSNDSMMPSHPSPKFKIWWAVHDGQFLRAVDVFANSPMPSKMSRPAGHSFDKHDPKRRREQQQGWTNMGVPESEDINIIPILLKHSLWKF